MVTRQSELLRVLSKLAEELPDPHWVALVDSDGLVMACVPDEPSVDPEGISAMTAALVITGERVLNESINFQLVDMMTGVIEHGTGNRVRKLGFALPAAGKTGTTNDYNDAWFTGFTANLST